MSEQLGGAELPPRVKPQQSFLVPSVGHEGFEIATDLIGVWSVLYHIYRYYSKLAANWQARVLVMQLACLTVCYKPVLLVADLASALSSTPYHFALLCLGTF